VRRAAPVLLALLLLAGAQQASATLAIVWRSAVLSWDSPTSQWQDELASQGAAGADPRGQAHGHLAALGPGGRLTVPGASRSPDGPVAAADHTRSPPAV
jgi:hypothetical protein